MHVPGTGRFNLSDGGGNCDTRSCGEGSDVSEEGGRNLGIPNVFVDGVEELACEYW